MVKMRLSNIVVQPSSSSQPRDEMVGILIDLVNESVVSEGDKDIGSEPIDDFLLKDRLCQLYSSKHTTKDMQRHKSGVSSEHGVMRHPINGKA